MEKKTLLAIVLSVLVLTGGFLLQNVLFPSPETPAETTAETAQETEAPAAQETQTTEIEETVDPVLTTGIQAADADGLYEREITVETDLFIAQFSTRGGELRSLQLKEHTDGNELVEMVHTEETDFGAFQLHFGNPDTPAVDSLFHVRRIDSNTVEFYREFFPSAAGSSENSGFMLAKRFVFYPDDYMFEVQIRIENNDQTSFPDLNFNNVAYTLSYGPQIGPSFEELDGRREYRRFYVYRNGNRRRINPGDNDSELVEGRVSWAAIAGKYFAVVALPGLTDFNVELSTEGIPGLSERSSMHIIRPFIRSSANTDTYRFYVGPKNERALSQYNDSEENALGISGVNIDEIVEHNIILGFLENILKFMLVTIHRLVPNWGISIIVLTIIIKILLFPLTHKGYESTSKVQALSPKVEELKAKYGKDPNKLNSEIADLYKKEGVNPLGGCLPMLAQLPIFITMYGLFSSHFDLRGASFISPWINDLSSPDSIFQLPFEIPILGWTDLRLLPILFLVTQLFMSKVTQMQNPQTAGANSNMKMITLMLPIVFFFILYDMPAGLLLYWTVTNVLTAGQQIYINKMRMRKTEK
ncbi:MAG: membrane protein insertase YidC [Spirochaetia bacterium]